MLPEVLTGETADVYFLRITHVLEEIGRDPQVGMQIFCGRIGIFCGTRQVRQILASPGFDGELWMLDEGETIAPGEAVAEIFGRYGTFGRFETAILGVLASCTGWATAARQAVDAAGDKPVVSFGARHVHPNVAAIMDYASIVGGCVGCSTPLGSKLAGTAPSGTMPHAFILVMGDTVKAGAAFDQHMPEDVPRIVLVDTFQDEALEAGRVAHALGDRLQGIRVDTPSERGGVTPALVKEIRARLDLAGFQRVQISVSGGMTPERILGFREAGAPVDSYGVGSFISGARAIDFTADIREIEGVPVAKRGRIPGMQRNPRLRRILPD